MANYVVSDTNLTLIADAIRAKSGHNELLEWPNEYKTSIDNLNPVDMCIKTATDNIVSVSDAAQYDAKNVSIKIEPVQDLHGYENPWPAGGGENLLNPSNVSVYDGGQVYGLIWTWDSATGAATVSGTWNINNTNGVFRFLNVPSTVRETCNITAFSDSANFNLMRWQEEQNVAVLQLKNMAKNQSYSFKVYPVAYVGSTAPTTYSPYSNICPITGWTGANVTRTGKNLFDYRTVQTQTRSGITLTNNNDGTFTLNGTATSIVYFDIFNSQFSDNHLPYGTYTLSGCPSGGSTSTYSMYVRPTYTNDYGRGATFTQTVIGGSIVVYAGQTLDNLVFRPQIEIGSTKNDFEPYQGDTYDITFPSEAGTVYGGTLDVVNGVLTVDRAMVDLGTLTWTKITTSGDHWRFWAMLNTMRLGGQMISSQYRQIGATEQYMGAQGIANQASGSNILAMVSDERYADAAAFKAAMSGVQLCYELATPITYTLTPQQIALLRGNNTLWADTGDTTLTYYTEDFADLADEIGYAEGGDY